MNYSLGLGKISGIKITVHWTFFLLLAWVIISGVRDGDNAGNVMYSLSFILSLFMCVILHELGHALMAKRFLVTTRQILLLPIGGVAQMDRIPEKPQEEFFIAVSGPIVNLIIGGLLYLYLYFTIEIFSFSELSYINGHTLLPLLFIANITLALFNLLPAFPMDGGRILRALLSIKMNREKATQIAAGIGQAMATVFVLAGIFGNPFFILAGIFIYFGAHSEAEYVHSHSILKNYTARDVMMKGVPEIQSDATIDHAVKMLLNGQGKEFLIKKERQVIGILGREQIIRALHMEGQTEPVINYMVKIFKSFSPSTPLQEVYDAMISEKSSLVPVLENGIYSGAIDLENVLEFIMIRDIDTNQKNSIPEKSPVYEEKKITASKIIKITT